MADILVYRCKLPTDTLSRAQYLHVYFCLLFLVSFSLFYLAFCQLSGVEFLCYSSSFCDLAFKSLEFLISFPCHLILCCLRRFFLQTAHINSFCKKKKKVSGSAVITQHISFNHSQLCPFQYVKKPDKYQQFKGLHVFTHLSFNKIH